MHQRLDPRRAAELIRVSPLEAKLLGLVLLCLLPAFLTILHLGIAEKNQEREAVRKHTELVAHLASADCTRVLAASRELLHTLSRLLDSIPPGGRDRQALLADVLADHPDYLNLGVIAPDGKILESAVPHVGPLYLGDRAYFRRAMTSRRFSVGDYQVGRITQRPSVNVAYPEVGKDGQVARVVFAALDLGWVNAYISRADLPPDATMVLIDEEGVVLARVPDPGRWIGRPLSEGTVLDAALKRRSGTVDGVGPDGIARLYGIAPLSMGDEAGSIVVGIPKAAAFAAVDRAYTGAWFALGVIVLLALVAAKVGGRLAIVAPVRALVAAADHVARVDPGSGGDAGKRRGELDRLAGAIHGMAEALAERRRVSIATEEELRLSESRFRAFMENSPAICFIKNAEGKHVYANRRFEEVFQRDATGLTDHQWLPHETAAQLRAHDIRVIEDREPMETMETVPDPDGTPRRWWVVKFPIEGSRGEILVGGIALDMSAREELERRFLHAQKLEAVGRLAGGVAHDFNNLLTALLGQAGFLERHVPRDHPGHRHLRQIRKAGDRAAELTGRLLAFSRRQAVEPQVLDLNQVIADLEPLLRRLIGEDVDLSVEPSSEPAQVEADRGQIEQVIMNLAVNARDAMPRGGRLILRTDPVERDAETAARRGGAPAGSFVALSVSDDGEGMDAETRERIFEPFFTTKEPGKGTGLGLATVYGIVKQLDGEIEVQTRVGEGTVFTILLPRASREPGPARAPGRGGSLPGGSETVLVIEDDELVREVTRSTLEDCGYRVLAAPDGIEGIRFSATHPGVIDLVVADVVMPRLSGPAAVQRILQERPQCRALFVSGYDPRVLSLEEDSHFGTCLAKPFTPEVLARAVRRLLDEDRRTAA